MSVFARSFCVRGWRWGEEVLSTVVTCLVSQGIECEDDMRGLDMCYVQGTDEWPAGVLEFVSQYMQLTVYAEPCTKSGTSHAPAAYMANILERTPATPSLAVNPCGKRPGDALSMLRQSLPVGTIELAQWRKRARVAAVLGSGPRSLASMKSGLRHWIEYIRTVYPPSEADAAILPPRIDDVLGWSHTFRCLGTFANYLGHLKGACIAVDCEPPPQGHPAIKRAMIAIVKRRLYTPRQAMFLQRCGWRGTCCVRVCCHMFLC